ncbi:DUF2079 domain-containing protein [Spirillospora sp. NPDC048911]|uniref:DUF2079 domain-containing protein n=1 Tax=Spirillospora sp. NPDC048911 TaxID=3364527 RepID=UPI00371FECCE
MHSPRRDLAAWTVAATFFAAYSAMAVNRHHSMRTAGYDLGIFEQAVRAYAHLRVPVAELKGPGFNVLGDHFHPVLVLLAPFYRLFPGPITLLIAQALLLAWSAVPVTRLATNLLGGRAGSCFGFGYGLSWGIQQAAAFDFHEIAFAVPLVARSVELLAYRRWSAAARWALPLLLVKEDQALLVAAIGGYLFCLGKRRRLGALIVTVAIVAGVVTVFVIIPAFSPGHVYPYAKQAAPDTANPLLILFSPVDVKGWTLLALVAPTLLFALRSPLILIAVPYIAARFWSGTPAYWGTGFHYSAVLMPIVFVAAVDGLRRARAGRAARVTEASGLAGAGGAGELAKAGPAGGPAGASGAGELAKVSRAAGLAGVGRAGGLAKVNRAGGLAGVGRVVRAGRAVGADGAVGAAEAQVTRQVAPMAILAFALTITALGDQPLTRLVHPVDWQGRERFEPARKVLAAIPDGANVATSNRLAPQLTHRCRVFRLVLPSPSWPLPEWVAVASSRPFPKPSRTDLETIGRLPRLGYRVVERGGGVVIYRRTAR